MNARRARSLALTRSLTAAGSIPKRKKRLPKQQQPDAVRLEYAKAIEELVCERARAAFEPYREEILADLARLRRRTGRADAGTGPAVELRVLEPLFEDVFAFVGFPRRAPAIVASPEVGALLGDVLGAFAAYYREEDVVELGAEPLRLLARPLALRQIGSDEDALGVKVVIHEALHAAARNQADDRDVGRGPRALALQVVEEATAEIGVQLLLPRFAPAFGEVLPHAAARIAPPLFRWTGSDLYLSRPTSYPTWVSRFARLAALARVPLQEWTLGIRSAKGLSRLDSMARWLGASVDDLLAYLVRERGEPDNMAVAARVLRVDHPPALAPTWALAPEAPLAPGEIARDVAALLLAAEAKITAPQSMTPEVLAAVEVVDRLGDQRASFHARTALQQRVLAGTLLGSAPAARATGPRAALVLAFDPTGRLLFGKRRSGEWAVPGGGVEPNESPLRAAARELEEETNLTTGALDLVGHATNRAGVRLWVYRCVVHGEPTGYFDPDREFIAFRFVDLSAGLPEEISSRLAGPPGADNFVRQLLPATAPRRDAKDEPPIEEEERRRRAKSGIVGAELGAAAKAGEVERRRAASRAGRAGGDLAEASRLGDKAGRLIDRAAARFAGSFRPRELEAVARQFGERTSDFQRAQLDRQVREAIGVPFSALERPIRDGVDEWAAQNVDLIRSVGDRYFDRLRLEVVDAYAGGTAPETLARQFADDYDVSLNDARRIARDQVGKLNADVNHERQKSLGVERGIWRGMNDNRECDDCLANEGKSFDLAVGIDGVLPGYCHPMDRCYTEPDLSALIPASDDG